MTRDLKRGKDIDIPEALLRDMPGTFRRRAAVLWDRKKRNLVYVFDVPNDPKKGKFVVEVSVIRRTNRGDRMIKRRGNFVTSAGRVPRRNLADENVYERIEGNF